LFWSISSNFDQNSLFECVTAGIYREKFSKTFYFGFQNLGHARDENDDENRLRSSMMVLQKRLLAVFVI